MRYALRYYGPKAIVHLTENDETRNSICGLSCSLELRYSRRNVSMLFDRKDCQRCLNIVTARKKALHA